MFFLPKLRVQLSRRGLEESNVQCQLYRREVQENEHIRHELLQQEVCDFLHVHTVSIVWIAYFVQCILSFAFIQSQSYMPIVCILGVYYSLLCIHLSVCDSVFTYVLKVSFKFKQMFLLASYHTTYVCTYIGNQFARMWLRMLMSLECKIPTLLVTVWDRGQYCPCTYSG